MNNIDDENGSQDGLSIQDILREWYLSVSGDRIDLSTSTIVVPERDLKAFDKAWHDFLGKSDDPSVSIPKRLSQSVKKLLSRPGPGLLTNLGSYGSGKLHKSLHKGLHKSLHKGLHKSLHKGLDTGDTSFGNSGFSWPVIEVPWREIDRLYDLRERQIADGKTPWDRHWFPGENPIDLYAPPTIDQLSQELAELHKMQRALRRPDHAYRRERIVVEATNDLTAYMLPLGADAGTPTGNTAVMFQIILWLGSMIGQQYKARYNLPRPNVLDPTLEPYIPVPVYSSWPSNHAFQSFLIAEIFSRMVPEHGGATALFKAAWEVAINREFAGLHYRSDTHAGMKLAKLIAPDIEIVLQDHRRGVRAEWLGESEEG